jgi:hypothetical protein
MSVLFRLAAAVVLVALLAGCGSAGKHRLVVGVVEDAAKTENPNRIMRLASDSGFGAIALSSLWTRGATAPAPAELTALRRATAAATRHGIRPIVAVYQLSSQTPLTATDRTEFAAYAVALVRGLPDVHDLIVGNEPNLNLFWLPQYQGSDDVAAWSFERLLAATYDAVKSARDDIHVIGAGLAPHGSDDPTSPRPTHSPTRFLLDMGAAYRASHRDRPIMDALSVHPYGESPQLPPTLAHPHTTSLGIADYRKLVSLLARAFGGTGQPGRRLPIVYGEYGVETTIPPAKASEYSEHEIVPTVTEDRQARYYATAVGLAACQPTVELLLIFHLLDEPRLPGLQSGVRYADGSPKASEPEVAQAAADPRCSTVPTSASGAP